MQFYLFILLTGVIYNLPHCFLYVFIKYLRPISPMQCFYGPV